ncbi:MAG TPA: IclR family transcriptional regulator [Nitrolancea sp.]|jgi:DNA-binding IclR family transcriptional regulator|nr:IclR family transcriptional regulator [Nitrolancea sp.]
MTQTILTLSKALTVIDALAQSHGPVGISELSRRLGLSKNQIFRVVKTLEQFGYIHQVDDKYALGLRFLELGRVILNESDLVQTAIPHLNEVRNATGECVCLFMLDGREAVCIALREGLGLVNITARVGYRYLLHAGAAPKAILANQPAAFVRKVIEEHGLPAYTPHTITDSAELQKTLGEIRERGFALSNEDMLVHAFEVAVPIYDRDDQVRAALSVTGPVDRFGPEERIAALRVIANVCDRISVSLGAQVQPGPHVLANLMYATGQLPSESAELEANGE